MQMADKFYLPKTQRALVFQGGGSLGAYEAGVFHILYHWIRKDNKENENEAIFDIIAGLKFLTIFQKISSLIFRELFNVINLSAVIFFSYT